MKKKKRNKTADLKILATAFYANLEVTPWGFGGIGLNPKRPFGNSDACSDMLKLLEWEPEGEEGEYSENQEEYVYNLYQKELIPFLRKNWLTYTKSAKVAEVEMKLAQSNQIKNGSKRYQYPKGYI